MSKKKKKWELPPDTDIMETGCDLIDALLGGGVNNASKPIDIQSIIDDSKPTKEMDESMELLGKKMAAKKHHDSDVSDDEDPLTKFIDTERIDTPDEEEEQDDEPKENDFTIPGFENDEDDDYDDTGEEPEWEDEEEQDDIVIKPVSVTESDIPGRFFIDDGYVKMPFSFDYPKNLNISIDIEDVCRAIRDDEGLGDNTEDIVDGVSTLMHIIMSLVVFTRHPMAILTEGEFQDYFESFAKINPIKYVIVQAEVEGFGDCYCIISISDEDREMVYKLADRYVDAMSSNSDNNGVDSIERMTNGLKFFIALAMWSHTINNECAYDQPVYLKAIKENCVERLYAARDIASMISDDKDTERLDIRVIEQMNSIDEICDRLNVITDYSEILGGTLNLIDMILGTDRDDEDFMKDIVGEIDDVLSDINGSIDQSENEDSIPVSNADDGDEQLLDDTYYVEDPDAIDPGSNEEAIPQENHPQNPLSQGSESEQTLDDDTMIIPARRRPPNM